MAKKNVRKVCFVITSHIHYARSKLILQELQREPQTELFIVVGASAILDPHGDVLSLLERDGLPYHAKIHMMLEGGNPIAMAKTTGIGIMEFATAFDNLRPDIVVVRGDRYEVLAAAIAAAYLHIPIAHIEGGDTTGTIDESVRHAITKLAHIHFTTHEAARRRVLRMGEHPRYVFNFGAPELEFVTKNTFKIDNDFINRLGVGDAVDINEPFLMVMQHPVTSEVGKNRAHIEETLHAVHDIGAPTIWFWPNVDAGSDEVSRGIRVFREKKRADHMRFIKYLPAEEFIGLLKKTHCLVGNSSAGIKESSYLGIPVVNIGTRQNNRLRGRNVLDVSHDRGQIKRAIEKQLSHGPYKRETLYCKKNTCTNIVKTLKTVPLYTQKSFHH